MKLDIYSQQILAEDGFEIQGTELIARVEPRSFYQADFKQIIESSVDVEEILPKLTPMGQKMAQFLNWHSYPFRNYSFEEFVSEFFWRRKLTRFILNNPEKFYPVEVPFSGLVNDEWVEETQTKYLTGHFKSAWALANALAFEGVKTVQKAIAFCNTYTQFQDPNRSWNSSKQIEPVLVARVATEPRLKRLPYRYKKQFLFLHMGAYLGYPQYIDKNKNLSTRKIIDYIDSCSLIFQLGLSSYDPIDLSIYPTLIEKVEKAFSVNGYTITSVMDLIHHWNGWKLSKGQWKVIEALVSLPMNYLYEQFGQDPLDVEKILGYLDPKLVCRNIFGSEAKTLVASFKEANLTQIRWAEALQPCIEGGNIDVTNKVLKVDCLPLEDKNTSVECRNFLNHIGWKPALRMLQKQTYKYRGEEYPVQEFLIRDTGYLFNQLTHLLRHPPELGRVQCWLSIHEQLSKEYVALTPDEVLPIHSLVKGLDGVASIEKNWTIRVPKNTRELKYYGEYLKFCIGGYGPYVQRGGIILLIEDGKGMPAYGIQIDPKPNGRGDIIQFYGARNSHPDRTDQDGIEDTLRQAKVIL